LSVLSKRITFLNMSTKSLNIFSRRSWKTRHVSVRTL
jgi:hypothetical protein